MKVEFKEKKAFLEVTNDSANVLVLDHQKAKEILDIRSLGYYKIPQGVLQQRLSKYSSSESLQNIFELYNNFKKYVTRRNNKFKRSISLIRTSDPRRELTDKELLKVQ